MKNVKIVLLSDGYEYNDPQLEQSIAVHLHVFYVDLIPTLVKYLRNLRSPFDLYISIPETVDCDEDIVRSEFSMLPNASNVFIARTPNKGRDIAPMLCTFADAIRGYDLLLHLHTKKSPHDKSCDVWGMYMLEHILRDTKTVSHILKLLSEDYYFLCSYDFMQDPDPSGWGNEKCNLMLAQELVDRSSLKVKLAEDYPVIDYPQGSFFWCRTEALAGLFDVCLTYDDFPEEPIGVDGSIAHAIERLFFVWGRDLSKADGTPMCVCKIKTNADIILEKRLNRVEYDLDYFKRKNKKHLKLVRILIVAVLLLLFTLVGLFCCMVN